MNLPELKKSEKGTNSIDYRSKYKWDTESIILIYQGALNEGRGLRLLIELMQNIDNKFKLIVLGNGPLKQSLKDLLAPSNQQVKSIDTVPIKKLSDYTRGADIGINLLEDFNLDCVTINFPPTFFIALISFFKLISGLFIKSS